MRWIGRCLRLDKTYENTVAPQTSTGRGKATFFRHNHLPASDNKQIPCSAILKEDLGNAVQKANVVWVDGPCGAGKSTKTPPALLAILDDLGPDPAKGVLHCIPTNNACRTIFECYQEQEESLARIVCIWHGESSGTHMHPRSHKFVTLCILAFLFHLFQQRDRWADVRFLVS